MKMSLTGSFLGCVHFRLRITTEPILNTDQDKLPDVSYVQPFQEWSWYSPLIMLVGIQIDDHRKIQYNT